MKNFSESAMKQALYPPLMLQNILFRFVPLSKLVLLRWIWVMLGKA